MTAGKSREQAKQVTIQAKAGRTHKATVQPGESPRHVIARAMGKDSENMMLRRGADGYLSHEDDVYQEVEDGDTIHAVTNPVPGRS